MQLKRTNSKEYQDQIFAYILAAIQFPDLEVKG